MIDFETWKKAWALLDGQERRNAWITLGVIVVGAFSAVSWSARSCRSWPCWPIPIVIRSVSAPSWAYEWFGFTSDYAFLVVLGLVSFGVILAANGIQIAKTWVVARYTLMRTHSISYRLMVAYLRQPCEFFLNRHSGEMGTRILSEAGSAVQQFLRPAADLIASALTVLALLGFLIWIEPVIAIVALALLGGIYGAIFAFSRRLLGRLGRVRVEANSARFRHRQRGAGGIKDIKLLGREGAYAARFAVPSQRMARTQVTVQVIAQVPQSALQAVAFGGIILLCLALLDPARLAGWLGGGVGGYPAHAGGVRLLPGSG
ncbi:ABC transporter transmembrane domain-containing protein [Rhodophyticola sp.]|uniref:ABC transporter transmembrane domain-containing protein n=1 Tax=Rhodophyticola sp. TaxID=2680032 RepID=UPI003D26CAEA